MFVRFTLGVFLTPLELVSVDLTKRVLLESAIVILVVGDNGLRISK